MLMWPLEFDTPVIEHYGICGVVQQFMCCVLHWQDSHRHYLVLPRGPNLAHRPELDTCALGFPSVYGVEVNSRCEFAAACPSSRWVAITPPGYFFPISRKCDGGGALTAVYRR